MSAVLFERVGHTAWVTINRPEAKNVLNAEVFVGIRDAWDEVRNNPGIRVAVLTGAGEEDFCCGGDLGSVIPLWTGARQPETDIERELLSDMMIVAKCMLQQEPLYKPIIGAFNGRALGGGCEIMLATDIRIAAEHAQFGVPEPKSGLVPGAGTMVRLTRQISYANAMKMMLTADPISAEEAREIGLINEVLPLAQLKSRAQELADKLAANAPLSLQAIKKTVLDSHTESWADAFKIEMEQSAIVMSSKDAREGPRAFKEKRTPEFKGE